MTTESRVTALEQQVSELKAMLGDAKKTIRDWRTVQPPELSNEFYPVWKSFQQIYDSQNSVTQDVIPTLDARLTALERRPAGSIQIPQPTTPTPTAPMPDGLRPVVRELWFTAGAVTHGIVNSENDRGWGFCFNAARAFQGWRPGSSFSDPRMCQIFERYEQDGVVSWDYVKPDLDPNPNTAEELTPGDFDLLPGKSFLLKPGGRALNGRADQTVIIGTGEPGRDLEIGIVPAGGTPNEPHARLRLRANGVYVVDPNGTERKL